MSLLSDRRGEVMWAGFCLACAGGMLAFPSWEAVPFHWIWISLTFLYGFRRWSARRTTVILLGVVVLTTIAMFNSGDHGGELSEVPLMTCVFLGMVWHVRRRQEAVDAERQTAEREREFMRDAAHNLRTPLTVAKGHAELLLAGFEGTPAQREDAGVVLDELRRLARISDQLLLLGTASHAEAVLSAPVDLRELALRATGRWAAAADGREICVQAASSVVVLADEQRLRHALDALIENALHATGPGGHIWVRVAATADRATLQVADDGAGIAPEDLTRIFERFARGAAAAERPGTGLGLAIVRAVARAHGGDVTAESTLGAGTTFTMHLGAPRPAARPLSAPQTSPPVCVAR